MLDILGGLLLGVLQFYAWTVGVGLIVLAAIMLAEGAVDLIRGRRPVTHRTVVDATTSCLTFISRCGAGQSRAPHRLVHSPRLKPHV